MTTHQLYGWIWFGYVPKESNTKTYKYNHDMNDRG